MLASLSNSISLDNRMTQVLLGVVVLIVLIGVLFGLYRLIFSHRVRVPGGARARAPRLGVVDVFSVDGQRQLVIVRRDNVEHLLMIGGPNDLVVEPHILRAAAANSANVREMAKPPPEPIVEAAPIPRPAAPVASSARQALLRSANPVETAPPAPTVSPEPYVAPEPPPIAEPRVRAASTRIDLSGAKGPEPAAPAPRAESPSIAEPRAATDGALSRRPLPKPLALAPRPNLPSAISPRARLAELPPPAEAPKPVAEAGKAPDVVIVPPAPPSDTSSAPPPVAPEKRARAEDAFYDLESLEAEMARLLGRDG